MTNTRVEEIRSALAGARRRGLREMLATDVCVNRRTRCAMPLLAVLRDHGFNSAEAAGVVHNCALAYDAEMCAEWKRLFDPDRFVPAAERVKRKQWKSAGACIRDAALYFFAAMGAWALLFEALNAISRGVW